MYSKCKSMILEQNKSILQFAYKLGINPSDLYCAFNGNKPMYPKYKRLIAIELGASEEELFEESK